MTMMTMALEVQNTNPLKRSPEMKSNRRLNRFTKPANSDRRNIIHDEFSSIEPKKKRRSVFAISFNFRGNPIVSDHEDNDGHDDVDTKCHHITQKILNRRVLRWANLSKWKRFFIRYKEHDPRRQILDAFNDVARIAGRGIEEALDKSSLSGDECVVNNYLDWETKVPYARDWHRGAVFTVWRGCSFDAVQKMIRLEAFGKGMDVKGKSSKRGKLSGFVPFLQIDNEQDKAIVQLPETFQTMRLFFNKDTYTGGRTARKLVRTKLLDAVKQIKQVFKEGGEQPQHLQPIVQILLDADDDYFITDIDDYDVCRGLDIPLHLFWHVFIFSQNIHREKGSDYDMGRTSMPMSQQENLKSICSSRVQATRQQSRRLSIYQRRKNTIQHKTRAVVVLQNASDDPLNPFELLVAYEDGGKVLPVVSDFDCFLIGTRRVTYTHQMDIDQLHVMQQMIRVIEQILKTSSSNASIATATTATSCDTNQSTIDTNDTTINDKTQSDVPNDKCNCWLDQWSRVVDETGFKPQQPSHYGFGDKKSIAMIKNAINRLKIYSGAVQHGGECFNYACPQDKEDEYLIITDYLKTPANGNKPWKKVNLQELQSFLIESVDEGYTFPLNPKWIVCDGEGWKNVYRKLLKTCEKTHGKIMDGGINPMDIWFPKEFGIRDDIDRIMQCYPSGFITKNDSTNCPRA